MQKLLVAMLVLAGLVHLLPLPGVLGADTLAALYGTPVAERNLAILMRHRAILMRHRAILFGILGMLLLAAARDPVLRTAAIPAGLVSTVSFLILAWEDGGYNAQLARVVWVDVVVVACLLVAGVLHLRLR